MIVFDRYVHDPINQECSQNAVPFQKKTSFRIIFYSNKTSNSRTNDNRSPLFVGTNCPTLEDDEQWRLYLCPVCGSPGPPCSPFFKLSCDSLEEIDIVGGSASSIFRDGGWFCLLPPMPFVPWRKYSWESWLLSEANVSTLSYVSVGGISLCRELDLFL